MFILFNFVSMSFNKNELTALLNTIHVCQFIGKKSIYIFIIHFVKYPFEKYFNYDIRDLDFTLLAKRSESITFF